MTEKASKRFHGNSIQANENQESLYSWNLNRGIMFVLSFNGFVIWFVQGSQITPETRVWLIWYENGVSILLEVFVVINVNWRY